MMTLEDQIWTLHNTVQQLLEENLNRKAEIISLREQVDALRAEPPKRGPGRPPKVRETPVGQESGDE